MKSEQWCHFLPFKFPAAEVLCSSPTELYIVTLFWREETDGWQLLKRRHSCRLTLSWRLFSRSTNTQLLRPTKQTLFGRIGLKLSHQMNSDLVEFKFKKEAKTGKLHLIRTSLIDGDKGKMNSAAHFDAALYQTSTFSRDKGSVDSCWRTTCV